MEIRGICVIGGSGFVGSHIVRRLSANKYRVVVPTRQRERTKHLILLPTVDVVEADVHDESQLERCIRGCDVVINLVGVLKDTGGNRGFEQAHVELPRKIIAACKKNGITRLLHMSALGADANGPSKYQRTKAQGEALVRASALEWTIFRPSVVFGREDRFLNLFASLLDALPVIFLGSPNARFQPVYVDDVARAYYESLDDHASCGQTYELCGPHVYKLRELIELVAKITGHRRRIIGLGDALSHLQAFVLEWVPGAPLTRDNYRSMKVDNVCNAPFPFGIQPAAIEAIVPEYLGNENPRARYRVYRDTAGRPRPLGLTIKSAELDGKR
jgi:uncharacterized protein YbjT (DUF2867 family)